MSEEKQAQEANDFIDTPVEVGDKIVYTMAGRGEDGFYHGTVIEIENGYVKFRKNGTGRKMTRSQNDVVCISPLKEIFPENWI